MLARLGGESLNPYYCLIEGGKRGWFINEMRDFFYYAQILQQGENTIAIRTVSETISTKQLTNLMRAVGYYPSNEEVINILFNTKLFPKYVLKLYINVSDRDFHGGDFLQKLC